jgi:hypothetical protein
MSAAKIASCPLCHSGVHQGETLSNPPPPDPRIKDVLDALFDLLDSAKFFYRILCVDRSAKISTARGTAVTTKFLMARSLMSCPFLLHIHQQLDQFITPLPHAQIQIFNDDDNDEAACRIVPETSAC